MNRSIIAFSKSFSKHKNVRIKLIQKSSISLRQIILIFIRRKKWETVRKGYEAMGEINIELSECGFFSVFEDLVKYEIRLSESDDLDDYNGSKKRGHILC